MIRVESAGLLTTVQDLGRPGLAHLGISAAGAADSVALRIGNRLVGNHENAPALEMTITGGTYRFEHECIVAITGAECEGVPCWTPFVVRAQDSVRIPSMRSGARAYLCVRGGFNVPRVLGSASTHPMSGVGGRPLKRGDILDIGTAATSEPKWARVVSPRLADGVLRVVPGPQADWFYSSADSGEYVVSEDSDRMGVRLSGPRLPVRDKRQLLTEGVSLGAVQVPSDGAPIILFVDHQTTGGYPKIANVILADMWKVGQLRPRDKLRFETVTIERALAWLREQEHWIDSV